MNGTGGSRRRRCACNWFGAAIVVTASVTASAGTIRYVDDDAPGGGDGQSWSTAYQSLQDALDEASNPDNGIALVRVAQGVYSPTTSFQLITGVALVGGYAGVDAKDPNERDPSLHETVLSGGGPVVVASATGASAILDGFTITNGNATVGGGMFVSDGGNPTVQSCVFEANQASAGGGVRIQGTSSPSFTACIFNANTAGTNAGGISISGGSPMFLGCTFSCNSAPRGGAIYSDNSSPLLVDCVFLENSAIGGDGLGGAWQIFGSTSSPTLIRCTFSGNMAEGCGGGINKLHTGGELTLIDCAFIGNTASEGGAMRIYRADDIELTNCSFDQNSAGITHGGGIHLLESNAAITNCTFAGNSASSFGGGIYLKDGTAEMTNCVFRGNAAGVGGGCYNIDSSVTMINCALAGNSAVLGGGMNSSGSSSVVTNCTFSQNTADDSGGGIFNARGTLTMTNSILWANSDLGGMDESAQIDQIASSPVVNYSDVQGGWSGAGGIGNINSDPRFVDADGADDIPGTEDDDFRLQPGSPCIDAGDNTAVPVEITTDLDGNARFHDDTGTPDTGNPDGSNPIVDLGVYEFQGTTCLPDINGDHVINVLDLIDLLLCFGQPAVPGCEREDVNRDDTVNVLDLIDLLVEFGRVCP